MSPPLYDYAHMRMGEQKKDLIERFCKAIYCSKDKNSLTMITVGSKHSVKPYFWDALRSKDQRAETGSCFDSLVRAAHGVLDIWFN